MQDSQRKIFLSKLFSLIRAYEESSEDKLEICVDKGVPIRNRLCTDCGHHVDVGDKVFVTNILNGKTEIQTYAFHRACYDNVSGLGDLIVEPAKQFYHKVILPSGSRTLIPSSRIQLPTEKERVVYGEFF